MFLNTEKSDVGGVSLLWGVVTQETFSLEMRLYPVQHSCEAVTVMASSLKVGARNQFLRGHPSVQGHPAPSTHE